MYLNLYNKHTKDNSLRTWQWQTRIISGSSKVSEKIFYDDLMIPTQQHSSSHFYDFKSDDKICFAFSFINEHIIQMYVYILMFMLFIIIYIISINIWIFAASYCMNKN